MKVQNWMTEDVITVQPDEESKAVWNKILEHDIQQVPVEENRTLIGIISRTDLLRNVQKWTDVGTSYTWTVREVMTRNPETVNPWTPIEKAALMIYRDRISSLPVVQDDIPVGILTKTDMARALIEITGMTESNIRKEFEEPNLGTCVLDLIKSKNIQSPKSFLAYETPSKPGFTCLVRYDEDAEPDQP